MENNRYAITRLIGKGRTGGIYEAEDTVLGRKVALRRFYETDNTEDSSNYTEDFIALTHELGAIQHPELVPIFDVGVDEKGPYIINQLMEGERLFDLVLNKQRFDPYEVCDFAGQVLEALSVAHEAGFYHGALNPNSILCIERPSGGHRHIIMDLGLARLEPLILGEQSSASKMADPAFMAPEMFDGDTVNMQSDLYMVGQLCYYLFIGGHPYADKTFEESRLAHQEAVPPLSEFREDTPPELEAWVRSLTQLDPGMRPSSLTDAIQSLPKFDRPLYDSPEQVLAPAAHATTSVVATNPGQTVVTETSSVNAAFQANLATGGTAVLDSQKERNLMPFIIGAGALVFLVLVWMIFGGKRERSSATVVLKDPAVVESLLQPEKQNATEQEPITSEPVVSEPEVEEVIVRSEAPEVVEKTEESGSQLVWTGKKDLNFYGEENWRIEGPKLDSDSLIPLTKKCLYSLVIHSVANIEPLIEEFRCLPGSVHSLKAASLVFDAGKGIYAVNPEGENEYCTVSLGEGSSIVCSWLKHVNLQLFDDSTLTFDSKKYILKQSNLIFSSDWRGAVTFKAHNERHVRQHYLDNIFIGNTLAVEGEDYVLEATSEGGCEIKPIL